MRDYKPADLPEIDRVKVLVLGGHYVDGYTPAPIIETSRGWEFFIRSWVTLTGSNARIIAEIWQQLPSGMTDRCHNPRFGLRFYHQDSVVLEASVCWECNNVFLRTEDGWNGFDFDAQSVPAQELLAICKTLTARD